MRRVAILAILAFAGLACDSASQNPFVVSVTSINEGSPLLADVIAFDMTSMTFYIPTEVSAVEFANSPYSSSVDVDPGVAWYDFNLKRYSVRWHRIDGGPVSGPGWNLADFDHTQFTSAIVPFRGSATTGALLVPVAMKTSEPFASLATSGGTIALAADIDFVGASAINPDSEVHIPASLSVTFADFADE